MVELDDKVAQLEYVKTATQEVNLELKKLAYAHDDYDVKLNASGIEVIDFINKISVFKEIIRGINYKYMNIFIRIKNRLKI